MIINLQKCVLKNIFPRKIIKNALFWIIELLQLKNRCVFYKTEYLKNTIFFWENYFYEVRFLYYTFYNMIYGIVNRRS